MIRLGGPRGPDSAGCRSTNETDDNQERTCADNSHDVMFTLKEFFAYHITGGQGVKQDGPVELRAALRERLKDPFDPARNDDVRSYSRKD